MRTVKTVAAIAASVLSLGAIAAGVPSADIDKITLAYLNAKIYAKGAVSCSAKTIAARDYVGCFNRSLDGKSSVGLWLYEGGKFKALNGTAKTFAEGPLKSVDGISSMPLPLPADVSSNFTAALETFK